MATELSNQKYLEGVRNELHNIHSIDIFQHALRDLVGDSLLSQIEEQFNRPASVNLDELISIAFRIEQIAIRLYNDVQLAQEFYASSKGAFENAAKLFEQIAESQVISSRKVHLDLYLHGAVDFALGEFQANATVLARKVLSRFDFETDIRSKVIQAAFLLLKQDLLEMARSFSEEISQKGAFEKRLIQKFNNGEYDRNGVAEDTGHFITLEGILSFAMYLRTGNFDYYKTAKEKTDNALKIFATIRDPDNFVLTQLISLLIRQMQFCSLWHQLGDICKFQNNPILLRYLTTLATHKSKPIYELWDSQIQALPKVLDSKNSIVLQMPTSAGKTRVAEIKIAQVLASAQGQPCRCIYVAPFKSLASQVEESLNFYLEKVGYKVTSIFGSYESVDFEDILAEQSDVLVITPEKLDYLFRQNKEFFQEVKLIVVDEGHLLDNDVRGLRLEILLSRLKRAVAQNGLQILFISAVLPNSDEIATWLSQGEPNLAQSNWKPTKLRQGIFYWDEDWKGRIHYIAEKLEIITNTQKVLVQEFRKDRPRIRLKDPVYYPNTVYEIANELALDFIKSSPTIIFTAVRTHVDSISKGLQSQLKKRQDQNANFSLVAKESKAALESLARKVEQRLGDNFPLAQYIREGFAYHHGYLPDDLRTAIEESFRKEHLRILIATPTLSQGVNLPVHLMIVANLERGAAYPFLVRDFRNIAGRAGRALHETEGNVIFIQNTQSDWRVAQMDRYLHDENIEKVHSVLLELYSKLIQRKLGISLSEFLNGQFEISFSTEDLTPQSKLETSFQTSLLAMLFEELINETDPLTVRKAIDDTLFSSQWKADRTYYEPLVNYAQAQIRYITERLHSPNQRKAFYKTGFSLKSCKSLEEAIRVLAAQNVFGELRDDSNQLKADILESILKLVYIPEETSSRPQEEAIVKAMIEWINFGDINDLRRKFENSSAVFQDPLKVSDLIYRHFANDTPWTLNAVVKILGYLKDDEHLSISQEVGLLPAYMKYGVSNPVAAYVCGMGVTNRVVAKTISEYYYSKAGKRTHVPSVDEFREWIQEINFEDLLGILGTTETVTETWAVFRRYKLDARPLDSFANPDKIEMKTYLVGLQYEGRLQLLDAISDGDELKLIREPDNPYDTYALAVHTPYNRKLGYIRGSKAFTLSTLIDEGRHFSCAVEKKSLETNLNRKLLLKVSSGNGQ